MSDSIFGENRKLFQNVAWSFSFYPACKALIENASLMSNTVIIVNTLNVLHRENKVLRTPSNQTFSAHARLLNEATCLVLWPKFSFGLPPTWANRIGSVETARMRSLAWTVVVRISYNVSFLSLTRLECPQNMLFCKSRWFSLNSVINQIFTTCYYRIYKNNFGDNGIGFYDLSTVSIRSEREMLFSLYD